MVRVKLSCLREGLQMVFEDAVALRQYPVVSVCLVTGISKWHGFGSFNKRKQSIVSIAKDKAM